MDGGQKEMEREKEKDTCFGRGESREPNQTEPRMVNEWRREIHNGFILTFSVSVFRKRINMWIYEMQAFRASLLCDSSLFCVYFI